MYYFTIKCYIKRLKFGYPTKYVFAIYYFGTQSAEMARSMDTGNYDDTLQEIGVGKVY